jgi:hypothetical protein
MKREFHVRFCESLRGKYFGLLDFATAKASPLFVSSDAVVIHHNKERICQNKTARYVTTKPLTLVETME